MQRAGRKKANDTRYDDRLALLHPAAGNECPVSGEGAERYRSGLLVREVRGFREDVLCGNLDELGEGAVVGEPEDTVILAGLLRVVAPVECRVDDHLGPLVGACDAITTG